MPLTYNSKVVYKRLEEQVSVVYHICSHIEVALVSAEHLISLLNAVLHHHLFVVFGCALGLLYNLEDIYTGVALYRMANKLAGCGSCNGTAEGWLNGLYGWNRDGLCKCNLVDGV